MFPPGCFTFWLWVYKLGLRLIDIGLELEPLDGGQHPWRDCIAIRLQLLGGALENYARRRLVAMS